MQIKPMEQIQFISKANIIFFKPLAFQRFKNDGAKINLWKQLVFKLCSRYLRNNVELLGCNLSRSTVRT